jgi:hypothetical protein
MEIKRRALGRPRLTADERLRKIESQANRDRLRNARNYIPGTRATKMVKVDRDYIAEQLDLLAALKAGQAAARQADELAKTEERRLG